MRHSVVPSVLLAAGLLLAPAAAAQAAPCDGKFSCAPSEGADDPTPTQPALAPEADKKPTPNPEPTRARETQVAPAPAAPQPTVEAPRPVVSQAPVSVAPQPAAPTSGPSEPVPEATSASATPSASPTASATSASPSPSKSSNWNTPVDKGQETQAAVLASNSISGPNMLGLFGILGGVLLVGLGGLAFALWSKNRLSSH
ncbi:hypothetical protein SAMN04487917_10295 [Arthrobacter sp. yr096]|uniref:hypothetical protein n=1 Tax=unclassified Arthrobacter TaxID=235627 RepID=UPI00089D8850|nr:MULTISPECIES: hypothetical protein [unclassified Arthrobacter]SDW12516.1 hypothetical protein SAMN04487912_101496 [Arthrobacter sp. cf158]SEI69243.1 hypothetical protein SAMN04487917_10295 [Arthrobacter sp. yr096]